MKLEDPKKQARLEELQKIDADEKAELSKKELAELADLEAELQVLSVVPEDEDEDDEETEDVAAVAEEKAKKAAMGSKEYVERFKERDGIQTTAIRFLASKVLSQEEYVGFQESFPELFE